MLMRMLMLIGETPREEAEKLNTQSIQPIQYQHQLGTRRLSLSDATCINTYRTYR